MKKNYIERAKILVYDSDRHKIDMIREMLETEHFEIFGTTDYIEAISEAANRRYDIAIIDYTREHGEHTAKRIREVSNTLIILLINKISSNERLQILKTVNVQGFCDDLDDILIKVETGMSVVKFAKNYIFNVEFKTMMVMMRERSNLSQEEVAAAIGVKRGAIIQWENGICTPSQSNLMKLSELFKTTMDVLSGRIICCK